MSSGKSFARATWGQLRTDDLQGYPDKSIFRRLKQVVREIYQELDDLRGTYGGFAKIITSSGANSGAPVNFSPIFSGMTITGNVTVAGYLTSVGNLISMQIVITPSAGGTHAATGAQCLNLPTAAKVPAHVQVMDMTLNGLVGDSYLQGSVMKLPDWPATGNTYLISVLYPIA